MIVIFAAKYFNALFEMGNFARLCTVLTKSVPNATLWAQGR